MLNLDLLAKKMGLRSFLWLGKAALFSVVMPVFAGDAASAESGKNASALSDADWKGIRQAHEVKQHEFQPVGEGWQAHNPGQAWTTVFDTRGFVAQPQNAAWTWGLELQSYGFGAQQQTVTGKPEVKAEGQRLSYQRDATVQEWYVNDRRGLEHGFTVASRPEGSSHDAELSFTLSTRGSLSPELAADAQGVLFKDAQGATVLNYAGLKVWDADGQVLPSRFEQAGSNKIRVIVDERHARYPLTVDPLAQQAYLKAGNNGANDNFGEAVAISGDTVVIGASGEDSGSFGANSTADDAAASAGAAYVFVRSSGLWTQQAYLKPANTSAGDLFGRSVSISGDTVVVGAPGEDSSTAGVNSTPNEIATDAGAAYVFVRSGSTWTQQAYLKAGQVTAGDNFGAAVAVSGDLVVVGNPLEDSTTTVINSTPNDAGNAIGAANVYVRNGSAWTQEAYLKSMSGATVDRFGSVVAISGETVVVGVYTEDGSTTGTSSTYNNGKTNAGSAYIFVRNGGSWTRQAYLKAHQTNEQDLFGISVAVSGDTVVVGATQEDSSTQGINTTPNESSTDSGAAYVFVRNGSTWTQQAYLKAARVRPGNLFGSAVAVSGDTIVVGASSENSSSTGTDSTANDSAADSGAAYVFTRSGTTWTQQHYLKAAQVNDADNFGAAVAVSNGTVVVGADLEDSSLPAAGSPPDEASLDSGAAYVFADILPTVTGISPATGATLGGTAVTISGTNFVGVTAVTIGGAAATSVNVISDTQITAVTPAGTAGTASVQVSALGGTSAANTLFTYFVANVAPVITSNGGGASASISVAENGTAVTTVAATDSDLPAQTLTYSKTGTDAALFTLNPSTGVLAFVTAPDFELPADAGANNVYDLTVTVTDSGSPALTASQVLSITVTDGNEFPVIKTSTSHLAYETTSATRVSGNIVYSVNNATALAAQPFNRVRYRMENTFSSVPYFAETTFDRWAGLTVAGSRVPDLANQLVIQRNVNNLMVYSNHPNVLNSNVQTGRLEHWYNDYGTEAAGGIGSSSTYDYDDTRSNSSHYGSFQVHNLSASTIHTVLAWNNHGSSRPDIGFGNSATSNPDWTFVANGATNWKLQIYIENTSIPPLLSFTEDVANSILFYNSPFADDSATLTVTLGVTGGSLTANAVAGVTVGGSASSRTFTGTPAVLNTYFATAGNVTYLSPLNTSGIYQLDVTVSDGSLSTSTSSVIRVAPANDAPTDIALSPSSIDENNAANATVGTFTTTDVDVADTYTYTLVTGGGHADNGSFTILGNALRLKNPANYEVKSTYNIRVRSLDAGGLWVDKMFVVTVNDLPEAEIDVLGNGTSIASGDVTPSAADHTDFGQTGVAGGTVARTFTIASTGPSVLTLTGTAPGYVTLSGSPDFAVTTQPVSPVAATNGTTTFVVTFDPSSDGVKNATVSILNDDANESPYTFAITGQGVAPKPVPSASGQDVVTLGTAPASNGTSALGQFDVLRRGGFFAPNGHLAFPGFLAVGTGSPAVTAANASGIWKTAGGNLYLLARTGTTVPDVAGAQFATVPEVPGLSATGEVSILASLVVGSGGVTTATDTGLWSEIGGGGLRLLMREGDPVPPLPGAAVSAFASGLYATAKTGASTGEAVFSVTVKDPATKTAILRASVNGAATAVGLVAREGDAAPGVSPAASYANLAGSFSDPGRMDPQGNFVYAALTTPGSREGLWYQPRAGGTPQKVFFAGDTAPGTGNATFQKIQKPSIGSNGFIAFRGILNRDGDNSTNARNDGIWAGTATNPAGFTCILRRGGGTSQVSNLPAGSLVGNPWGGWLTATNRGAWKAWLDVNGDGNSAAPLDVHAVFTNLSGTMQLAVSAGQNAPGTAAVFSGFDLPVVGGQNQYAFLGTLGSGSSSADNQGLWKSAPNGGSLSLALRKGQSVTTSTGPKTVLKIDLPGSNSTDRRWEQPVMDDTGRLIVLVTFTDGSTSQLIIP